MANYMKPPTVLVSPKHSTSGGNVDPKHNAISAWVEVCIYCLQLTRHGMTSVAPAY